MTNQEKIETDEIEEEEERIHFEQGEKDTDKKKKDFKKKKKKEIIIQKKIEDSIQLQEIEIPILVLEKPKIEKHDIEINNKILKVNKSNLDIKIPLIKLEKPKIEIKKVKINESVPKLIKKNFPIKIPVIKIKQFKINFVVPSFNSKLPLIKLLKKKLKIPIFKTFPKLQLMNRVKTLDDKTYRKLEHPKMTQSEVILNEKEEERFEDIEIGLNGSTINDIEVEDKPDPLNILFSEAFSNIKYKKPFLILYKELKDDSTIGSFETLCARIYRQLKGGKPKSLQFKRIDNRTIRDIERWIKASGYIIRIDLDHAILTEKEESGEDFNLNNLKNPIREMLGKFPTEDLGFIIFKTNNDNLYKKCVKLLEKLSKEEMEHNIFLIKIKPKNLSSEKMELLTELGWGVKVEASGVLIEDPKIRRVTVNTLDDIFNKEGKLKHEQILENLRNKKDGIYTQVTKTHLNESELHLQIKWFMVKLLCKKLKLNELTEIKKKIRTEQDYEKTGFIPDIYIDGENDVYEIETFFLEDAYEKISEKVDNYENTNVKNINIIMDNLTLLLNIKEVKGIKKNRKKWEEINQKKINFYTLDLQDQKLIHLSEFNKKLEKFIELK